MAAGFRQSSRTNAPLKLVHDADDGLSDAPSTVPSDSNTHSESTDLHNAPGGEDSRGSSFCAFCAAPLSESGDPCCEDYAALIDQALELRVPPAAPVAAPDVAPPPA